MIATIPYYPSEKLDRFNNVQSAFPIAYRGYTIESFLRAYREVGSVFYTEVNGREEVILSGLEANEQAWRSADDWSYGDAVAVFREELSELHLTQLDREAHRRKRRLLNKGFKNTSIMNGMPAMARAISSGLASMSGKRVELHEALMGVFTRAQSMSAVKVDLSDAMIDKMVDFEEGFIGALFEASSDRKLIYSRSNYLAIKGEVLDCLHGIVKERLSKDSTDDLLDEIINQKTVKSLEPLSEEELIYDTYLLLIAGTGNTSKMICYCLNALAQNPEWTTRLRAELAGFEASSLGRGMADFPLLKATLMEVERLYPAAPVLPRVPQDDLDFQGYQINKGTNCLHMLTLMHYDDSIYEDASAFKPERWLDHEYPKLAHGTFGGGSHVCLGMNVARIHMPLTLGYLLSEYDFTIEKPPVVENYAFPDEVDSKTVRMDVVLHKK